MKLSLIVQTPGNKMDGKVLEIKLAQFLVGRDPQCHLRPASALISKRHCALLQRDGKAFVRDFDSTNGTFVNDEQVKGEVELHHNDKLKIGPLLFLVALEPTAAAVNRPTPPPPTRAPQTQTIKTTPSTPLPPNAAAVAPSQKLSSPPPRTPAAETPTGNSSSPGEEDIAALLLSLQDEGGSGGGTSGEVPDGSTVHDLSMPPEMRAALEAKEGQGDKKEDKNAKLNTANTSAAAKSILEKYMRRPRSKS
jgi:predicted component of type VI protein secretion system